MIHIWVCELSHHWLRLWLVTCLVCWLKNRCRWKCHQQKFWEMWVSVIATISWDGSECLSLRLLTPKVLWWLTSSLCLSVCLSIDITSLLATINYASSSYLINSLLYRELAPFDHTQVTITIFALIMGLLCDILMVVKPTFYKQHFVYW